MALDFFSRKKKGTPVQEEHWIPLSDLMTGLMMMFILVAIVFMLKVEEEKKKVEAQSVKVKEIAVVYDLIKKQLYADLLAQFKNDLPSWGAELTPDLTLRFKEPNVLFDVGQDALKPKFISILDDFFPRYVQILTSEKYRDSIQEIRIEGHTSSIWTQMVSGDEAYYNNMALSQSRTRSTLQHVLSLPKVLSEKDWLKSHLTANGLSSSKLIYLADGTEDKAASQRVEFRIRTNAEEKIADILKAVQQ